MFSHVSHLGRRAATIENEDLRLVVLEEGGHIAEILDKATGISPLWTPLWPSLEPSTFDPDRNREYGSGSEAKLLAGIMGHNLCLDIFGPPSSAEAAAGMTVHGDASVSRCEFTAAGDQLTSQALLPLAQIRLERRIELRGRSVRVREVVENLTSIDRPIGWTEHVTLGPPFLQKGLTEFRASAARSRTFETTFGLDDYLRPAADFDWPLAPRIDGGAADLRVYTNAPSSSAYTAHRMDPDRNPAFFVAFSPSSGLAIGYAWNPADFPWMGIWEENCSRRGAPWNGHTLTRGMEFGVSPMPETRREMVERGRLFGTPTFRWLPAREPLAVEYRIEVRHADRIPESLR